MRHTLWVAALLLGCGGGVVQRVDALPPAPPGEAYLRIVAQPADVLVYVDGAARGQLDGYAHGVLRVEPGPHRVELRKPGHYPWYGVVQAEAAAPVVIETHLVARPR